MDGSATRLFDGRYRIGELLGEGATGTVSRAHDELLGRTVAIKLLKPAYGGDSAFVERFYEEARAAARIVDPRVVGIYDLISDERAHAIVMEYVDGPSLAQALARDGRFVESRSIDIARQIANALAAAHAQGMVHRDLKPANVLTNDRGLIKVTDFGLAKAIGASALTIATPDALVGSVHYLSPEQARGQTLTASSDLYSLGIMLYQFRFGHVPYTGDSPIAIALAHVNEPSPTHDRLCEAMSSDLARIVERLLAKDPLERFASASALDAALAEIEMSRTSVRTSAAYGADAPTLLGTISAVPSARSTSSVRTSPTPAPTSSPTPTPTPTPATTRSATVAAPPTFASPPSESPSVTSVTSDPLGSPFRPTSVLGPGSTRGTGGARAAAAGPRGVRHRAGVVSSASIASFAALASRVFARTRATRVPALAFGAGSRRRVFALASVAIVVLALGAIVAAMRPKPVTLVDLRHRTLDSARAALGRDRLHADVVSRSDESLAAGRIVAQKPAPGAALHAGDHVTLVVSTGVPTIAVPNLVGISFKSAVERLKNVRLRVRYAAAFSDAPANDVIETVPPAGTRVRANSNAIVVISTGARPTVRYSTSSGSGGDAGD